jgi:hypothetical protein
MKRSHVLACGWGVLFSLLVFNSSTLSAKEGAAYLTFKKTAVARGSAGFYVIKKGDTIAGIIHKHIGIASPHYETIRRLNPHIPDLNRIYPGQKLILQLEGSELNGKGINSQSIRNYTAKKGDSITRIALHELNAKPGEVLKILRMIKHLNPQMKNLNKISTGQVLKIPGGRMEGYGKEGFASAPAAPDKEENVLPMQKQFFPNKHLNLITRIITQLNGTVITSGNYYIPIPQSGNQATIDCMAIPVAELDDGTTILLDFAGRLPDALAHLIQANWQNYHLVKMEKGEGIASFLQKIIGASKSYTMTKMEKPLILADEPQVKLFLHWLIAKNASKLNGVNNLGLIFATDKSQLLPGTALFYAKKKGIAVCEILDDKAYINEQNAAGFASSIPRFKGGTNDELLHNFLIFLGLDPLKDKEVKIFDTQKDGFNLSIKADLLVKAAGKTILIHKSKLPQQFIDILRAEGTEPVYINTEMPRKTVLEKILSALDIPFLSARFSLPEQGEKAGISISFPALKVTWKDEFYLIDFDMDSEIVELLMKDWGVKVVRY